MHPKPEKPNYSSNKYSKNTQRAVISIVTIGSILEWYEVFLYIYWAPTLSKVFFQSSGTNAVLHTLLLFAIAFMARPIEGLLFGHIGDKYGRSTTFKLTIIGITIPAFITAFLPTYAAWGMSAQIILGIAKFLQGIPAGGELPGAMITQSQNVPLKKVWSLLDDPRLVNPKFKSMTKSGFLALGVTGTITLKTKIKVNCMGKKFENDNLFF